MLIGAPEADARQPGVHKGGAVYKCSVQRPGDCSIIDFDKNGKNEEDDNDNDNCYYSQSICLINKMFPGTTFARTGQAYDNKSGQWLGSLVASSGEDGTVMVGTISIFGEGFSRSISLIFIFHFQACAPRYIYYVFMNRRDPVGVCHIARNNFTEFRHYRPCVDEGLCLLKI